MAFRVGQKVVCVNAANIFAPGSAPLVEDAIYTVRSIERRSGGEGVALVEIIGEPWDGGGFPEVMFHTHRFRPVVERKTDISIFTKMLTPSNITERA